MPEGAIYVGRPSRWQNIWKIGDPNPWGDHAPMTAAQVVAAFRYGMDAGFGVMNARAELAGRDLACWCSLDQPCHADVLLELANEAQR